MLDHAQAALAAGLCPIPPKQDGSKAPDLKTWREYQTRLPTDAELAEWFTPGTTGLGFVCGNVSSDLEMTEWEGRAIELDLFEAWIERCEQAGLGDLVDRVIGGYLEETPTGGVHLLWHCPDGIEGNQKLASRPGDNGPEVLIETRGEGGYVIVAPSNGSVHPTGKAWTLLAGSFATIATITADERRQLLEIARSFDEMPREVVSGASSTRTPNDSDDQRPGDWLIEHTTWPEILERYGWVQVYTDSNDITYWRRPGKTHGISATTNYNGSDVLKVFSTSTPFDTSSAYTRFAAWAVLEHGGDYRAAARAARALMPAEQRPVAPELQVVRNAGADDASPADPPALLLPDEFWRARPVLEHIRQAAHARIRSADLVFHAFLTRVAACTSHTFEIPPIVGAAGSLNYFVAGIGASGAGKSSGIEVASEVFAPPEGLDVMLNQPLGSGEGIAERFMGVVKEEGEDGKPHNVRRQVRHNVLMIGDEGAALTVMMERKGASLTEALRRAWTGADLGQANGSAERTRVIPASSYRLALIIGFQPELAGKLLADHIAGTPQRFVWAYAVDRTVPDVPPEWPRAVELPKIPGKVLEDHAIQVGGWLRHRLGVDEVIVAELQADALAKVRGEVSIDPLDSHAPLHRLKIAALLAIIDGRLDVNLDDWSLANIVWATSCRVRSHVLTATRAEEERIESAAIDRHARREFSAEAARRSAAGAVPRVARRLANFVHEQGDEGCTGRDLNRHAANRDRHLLDAAIDHAIEQAWIAEVDGRYFAGESRPR
jgi:hypothetical protein